MDRQRAPGDRVNTQPAEVDLQGSQEAGHSETAAHGHHWIWQAAPYLLRVAVLCSLVLCSGSLLAYAHFRTVRGETFLRAIGRSPMILGTRFENTWGVEAYEDLLLDRTEQSNPYLLSAQYIFWWGANADRAMAQYGKNVSGNELLSVVNGQTVVAVYIQTYFQPPSDEFRARTAMALEDVRKRLTGEQPMSWLQGIVSQTRWGIRGVAGVWVSKFVTTDSDALLMILEALAGVMLTWAGIAPLLLLVLSPSWLAVPVFWLWVGLAILYVVMPPRTWKWTGNTLRRGWSVIQRWRAA